MFRDLVMTYMEKHPEYVKPTRKTYYTMVPLNIEEDRYYEIWMDIVKRWNDKVIELSDGFLYDDHGTVKGQDGCIYLNVKGDCNYLNWNNAYILEFEAFKYHSQVVFAPLVFDDPEEYWAFVVKVKKEIAC